MYTMKIIRRLLSQTVDTSEVNKFNNLSRNWWKSDSQVKILLAMNQLRVPFIRDGLINTGCVRDDNIHSDQPLKNLHILDVGCGGGFLSESLARVGSEVTGIDVSENLINVANCHKNDDPEIRERLTYQHSSIENFASSSNHQQFDAVVSSEVIEHVSNKSEFVKNCVHCLKPGGSIFMTTISKTTMAQIFAIFFAENLLRIVPKGAHEYDKLISPHELQRILEDYNCYTRRIHGFTYNPLTATFSWIACHNVNYAIHAIKSV